MNKRPIVIDIGSYEFKVGLSGSGKYSIFSSYYGENKINKETVIGKKLLFENEQDLNSQEELLFEENDKILIRPVVERGIVKDFSKFNKLLEHTFDQVLKVDPKEHPIFLTERPKNPIENREKIIEILFEKYQSPSLYIGNQQVLSLYASNLTNGLVIDSGDGVTNCVPVFNGYAFPFAIESIGSAGIDVSNYILNQLIKENPNSLPSSFYQHNNNNNNDISKGNDSNNLPPLTITNWKIIKEIKEKLCVVPIDYNEPVIEKQHFKLPDGKEIKLNKEILKSGEILFNPSILNENNNNVSIDNTLIKSTIQSINKCDQIIQNSLYTNIVLSGGSTMFKGYIERLKQELIKALPENNNIKINLIAPQDRYVSSWIGSSILTSHSSMEKLWINKKEYQENGPQIVHKKCL